MKRTPKTISIAMGATALTAVGTQVAGAASVSSWVLPRATAGRTITYGAVVNEHPSTCGSNISDRSCKWHLSLERDSWHYKTVEGSIVTGPGLDQFANGEHTVHCPRDAGYKSHFHHETQMMGAGTSTVTIDDATYTASTPVARWMTATYDSNKADIDCLAEPC